MIKNFSSSKEVFAWLSGFINLERGQKPKSFRLDRMAELTKLAGNPQSCAPSIHIAGSKGKGSVTSMLAAMLTAAGLKTARYMSPHVTDIRERISCGDSFFGEDIYCSAGDELRHVTEILLPATLESQSSNLFDEQSGCEPTFWELLTLLFFLCARTAKCDIMVVETGMGGRLDSTNVLDPLVSVITLIELEHTAFLGNTIEAIAGEKAGIIKQGKPLVLAKQCDEALKVFREKALKKNSPLFYLPEIAEISDIKITKQGTEFNLFFNNCSLLTAHCSTLTDNCSLLTIPIPGKVQAENAALAIATLKIVFQNNTHVEPLVRDTSNLWFETQKIRREINKDIINNGLASLKIPARFEKIECKSSVGYKGSFIIDGAHTPESLALCIETFCSLYGDGGVLLFGCAADKDAVAMAKIAHSHFIKIIITTPGTFKISNPEKVFEGFTSIAEQGKTELVLNTQEAVLQAVNFAQRNNLPVLGTGSFYLVSEIKKITCQLRK